MRELSRAMPMTEGETHRPHPNNQLPANATPSPARRDPSQAILSIRVGPCLSPGLHFCRRERPLRRQALSRFGASFLLPDSRPERCDGHDQYAVIAAIGLPTSAGKEHHEFGVSDLSHGIAADFVAEGFELIRIVIVHLKVTEFYFDGTPPAVRQLDNDINFKPLVIAVVGDAMFAPGMADRYTFKSRMHSVSNRSPSVCVSRIRVFGAAPKTAAGNEGSTKYRLGLVRTRLFARSGGSQPSKSVRRYKSLNISK